MDNAMTGPRPTAFLEALDVFRTACLTQGEIACGGDPRAYEKARKLADRAFDMVKSAHFHAVEIARNQPRWALIGDGDGHDYLIRSERIDDFFDALDGEWAETGVAPQWAIRVGGGLTFADPRIDGREVRR